VKPGVAAGGATAPGFRDLLPPAAESLRATQEAVLAEMRRWGYRFVVTPAVESLDVLATGLGEDQLRRLFKFSDADGSLLAIVGEKTVPAARLAAGPLRATPLPLRLCYAASVLSNEAGRFAHRRESHQVGAELIGAPGEVADAEVIAMAVRSFGAAGLRRYQLDVGHSEFFHGLLGGLRLSPALKTSVTRILAARDFVALEELLESTPLRSAEHDLLLRFPALRGGPEILQAAGNLVQNRRSERALAELVRVGELLAAHGLGDAVNFDLGAIRDFDYYTGIIFEGYGPDLGRPLASGGRYDRLLEAFGRPAAATGFVIHLDLVAEALARGGDPPALPRLDAAVAWSAAGLETALRLGSTLRLFGMRAAVDTRVATFERAREWQRAVGAEHLLHCRTSTSVTWVAGDARARRMEPEQAVARLAGAASR
jgi:ATP phosphoribosyltransferase regulatory subunit